ncbi:alkaline phosphatase D family protein, partial [Actinophytocola sp.]|uniref:alkaline phosphatase D family protein n=1 Tax=Actinophytocola sp. TaxID=1872138 RepID=UPI00389AF752
MRTYRNANGPDNQTVDDQGILGTTQAEWLRRELAASRATWKVIAADMPLSLVVPDATRIEAVAQGDDGAPLGRELQLAGVLSSIKRHRVRNVVWITTDVHYTAAHYYDPEKAAFQDFDPFWEFVSGPLNAGAFGPNALDPTFGPRQVFAHTPPAANASPLAGFQHFGEVNVDGGSGVLTVDLRTGQGVSLWSKTLVPQRQYASSGVHQEAAGHAGGNQGLPVADQRLDPRGCRGGAGARRLGDRGRAAGLVGGRQCAALLRRGGQRVAAGAG